MTIEPPYIASSFPISALFDYRAVARSMSDSTDHPPILYHYTDAAGLVGILNPSWDVDHPGLPQLLSGAAQLQASDVRHMNDTQELLFGAEPLVKRLRAAAADSSSSAPHTLAAALNELANAFSNDDVFGWTLRCFAACFCESGDLLSQWRGYAGGIDGYAIGFSWDALAEHSFAFHPESTVMGTTPFPAWLRRVGYGKSSAKAAADRFIDTLAAAASSQEGGLVRTMIEGGETGLFGLATVALGELAAVKHGAFKQEKEWRLLNLSEPQYPVNIRARRAGVLPYLNMAVNMKAQPDAAELPPTIAKVVVGPGPNQLGQVAATRELMRACGRDPDVVVPSKVPFRG